MGINLGALMVDLHDKRYDIIAGRLDGHSTNIEKWTDQLSTLTDALEVINTARQQDKSYLDFSEHSELLDKVRQISPKLLPEGQMEWKNEDAISILTENFTHESKKIATLINPEMMKANQHVQDVGELTKLFAEIIKICREEGQRYVHNQK